MKYLELVVQRKEGRILSDQVPERPKLNKKIYFFWLFWDKYVCGSLTIQKCEIFLQILNSVNNADILATELVGDQYKMVV